MDVNGTRFHLILGEEDWRACREPDQVDGFERVDLDGQALTLRPLLSLFRPDQPGLTLSPTDRRGAGADRFGNWYWIGHDQQTIYWSRPGGRARVFWDPTASTCPVPSDGFRPVSAEPTPDQLSGLAVTEQHYLVVGNASQRGLSIFDLHAGSPPIVLQFPAAVEFTPFDLAPAPGGGVWILDREHRAYWGLDRTFGLVSERDSLEKVEEAESLTFRPVHGDLVVRSSRGFPRGFRIEAVDPISIESLPDGSVLVLERAVAPGQVSSSVLRYRFGARVGVPVPLEDDILTEIVGQPMQQRLGIVGHDLSYVSRSYQRTDRQGEGRLFVADDDGKQVVAFSLAFTPTDLALKAEVDYLPLISYGGRALGAAPAGKATPGVFYDLARGARSRDGGVRWVEIQPIAQPRYVNEAELLLSGGGRTSGEPPHFDGKERDCVWHRLFIDGCIPSETSVTVLTRAANTFEALESLPFLQEPTLYPRGAGSEMPFYQPSPERSSERSGHGTWETLFQAATGRYIQVKLVLRSNGRASPSLQAARIYYPRFSYPRRYLPAVYQDDPVSASFTERLLANPEGFFTEIEGKIAQAALLFDPRTAPPDALDWLAGWLGLLLDPLWAGIQSRRQQASSDHTGAGPTIDRRRLFIRFARKLYERRGTPDGIRLALHLLLDPCLEVTLQAFKKGSTRLNPALRGELDRLGLAYPTPVMSELELENLLLQFTLAPGRPSKIRLVEHFQTRDGRARAMGDVTAEGQSRSNAIAATAHRFTVLVPERLLPEEASMVERLVRLEKPAHTRFDVERYYDYFRVGEARLGIDSVLGEESHFLAMVLDRNFLAQGYLAAAAPMDTLERLVADRDRPGERSL